jgi:hypothetical protein
MGADHHISEPPRSLTSDSTVAKSRDQLSVSILELQTLVYRMYLRPMVGLGGWLIYP